VSTDCHNSAVFSTACNGEIVAVADVLYLGVSNIRCFNLVERVQEDCDVREGCMRKKPHQLLYSLKVQPSQRRLALVIPLKIQL